MTDVEASAGSANVDFRLTDPAVAKEPGSYFDELRSKCPVAHTERFDGFWMLSRYQDVYEAALKPEVYSSSAGICIPVIPQPPVICLEQDDPEHRKYRKPMQGWFSVRRMAELEDKVREIVTRRIDAVVDKGHGDLAEVLASPVPPMVIALILGLPEQDWDWFRERESTLLSHAQSGNSEAAGPVFQDIANCLGDNLAQRRETPRDDMLSDIASLEIDGQPVSDEDAGSLAFLILGAGHETTVGGIGGLLYQVAKDADLRDRLIADPSLIERAVEESLRLETPLLGLARILKDDAVVDGVTVSAGERVMLLWGAANRDPLVFESPEEFRVDRDNAHKHISFGAGVHRCVGAPLARLEMRVVLEEVLRRMPNVHLTDPEAVRVAWTVGREFSELHATW
ncbi:cytochrome P450 [uncultured Jatrophihabitans sp.]|uniref:cytochrome P450 n=1 Tax=uncultured Jatrophihabitans sp. TaxID=1610747 RepID=UPI0035CA3148